MIILTPSNTNEQQLTVFFPFVLYLISHPKVDLTLSIIYIPTMQPKPSLYPHYRFWISI